MPAAKQTTIKVQTKDWKAFEKFAPTEGVKIIQADQLGDVVIAQVKFRDQGYLYYLGYNVHKAMTQQQQAPTADGQKKDAEKPKTKK